MTPITHQNWASAPRAGGSGDVHAEQAREHCHGPEKGGDDRQYLHHLVEPVGHAREVRLEHTGHPVLEHDGLVGDPHESDRSTSRNR